jgi:hypothetical protein
MSPIFYDKLTDVKISNKNTGKLRLRIITKFYQLKK